MASAQETAALVALLRAAKRPPQAYSDLVEDAGSALAVLENEHGLLAGELAEQAAAELATWRREGLGVLTVLDPEYPENLGAVHDRPPLLFVAGVLKPDDARSVAVIGSRRASQAGLDAARRLSERLVEADFTVVSGLAAGVDSAAHTAALERRGRTIAVIGTGLHRAYPPQNSALQRRIASEGAVLSQFWPDAHASRSSFPRRNAVMSGVSLATVIVEATMKSGARTQARQALAHGRPVLLMESLLVQDWASELAERSGTHVIATPAEVVDVVERLASTDSLAA